MARTIAKDHAEKRAQILTVAARIIAAEGYDRASMNRIAEACGISKANIYHYYEGKDALLFDLLEGYLTELRTRVLSIPTAGLSPEERLHRTVREILRAYQGADDVHRVLVAGLSPLPEARQRVLQDLQRDMVRRMSDILVALAPQRFEADRAALRSTAMSVFGMVNWYYMWNSAADAEMRDAYADLVARLTIGGVQAV